MRTTVQALAAVLGGAQSLHTNGMDEAFAIPTEEAMKIALRTQQVIADETNVANVIDPLLIMDSDTYRSYLLQKPYVRTLMWLNIKLLKLI